VRVRSLRRIADEGPDDLNPVDLSGVDLTATIEPFATAPRRTKIISPLLAWADVDLTSECKAMGWARMSCGYLHSPSLVLNSVNVAQLPTRKTIISICLGDEMPAGGRAFCTAFEPAAIKFTETRVAVFGGPAALKIFEAFIAKGAEPIIPFALGVEKAKFLEFSKTVAKVLCLKEPMFLHRPLASPTVSEEGSSDMQLMSQGP
jgi:hypothetical protein